MMSCDSCGEAFENGQKVYQLGNSPFVWCSDCVKDLHDIGTRPLMVEGVSGLSTNGDSALSVADRIIADAFRDHGNN